MKNYKYNPSKYFLISISLIGLSFVIMQFIIIPNTYEKYLSAQVSKAEIISGNLEKNNILTGVIREQDFHELDTKTNTVFTKDETFFLDLQNGKSIELKDVSFDHDMVGSVVEYDSIKNIIIPVHHDKNNIIQNNLKTRSKNDIEVVKTLVLLAEFQNSTPVEATAQDFQDLLFTKPTQSYLKRFFSEMTHGKVQIGGDVFGWYRFKGNGSLYTRPQNFGGGGQCFLTPNHIQRMVDFYGVTLSTYQRVIVITNCEEYSTIGGAYYGESEISIPLIRISSNHTRLNLNGFDGYETFHDPVWNIIHEMGHTFGIKHASSIDCGERTIWVGCTDVEYGNPFDVMGHWNGRIFNFINQQRAGWISSDNILEIREPGEYFINNLQTENGVVGAKIFLEGIPNSIFAVEHRKSSGFDQGLNSNVTNGLILYSSMSNFLNSYWLFPDVWKIVDPNPSNLDIYDDLVNDSITDYFYDEVFGIGIQIISVTSEGINFSVTYDTENSICVQNPQSLPSTMCSDSEPVENFSVYLGINGIDWGATWDTVLGAIRYKIQVSINDDFIPILFTYSNIGNTNGYTSIGNLTAENTYFFRIRACPSNSNTNCSQWSSSTSLYFPPLLPSPENFTLHQTTDASSVIAMWDFVPEATNYRIQVSMNENFYPSSLFYDTGNTNNFTSNFSVVTGNTYFFRIRSCITNTNCSYYSPSISLYIEPL